MATNLPDPPGEAPPPPEENRQPQAAPAAGQPPTPPAGQTQAFSLPANRLRLALWIGFFLAAVLTAYLTFILVRGLVTSWEMTSLPGVAIKDSAGQPGSDVTPQPGDLLSVAQPAVGPTPPPWDGAERVSLLVMGLDYRDWAAGEGPPRTDTMILFSIDPVKRTAGFISIPRDLWVNIPGGHGYGRINTAYQIGEGLKLPGGGAQLAEQTVEELLGIPIQYYAQVDFSAFIRFIDEIGGVTVDVPEKIKVDPLGDGNAKTLKPGRQTLPGELALAYARARKTGGGDFDRAFRQQQIIMGIRERILEYNMLPILISKAPQLFQELSGGVTTNLSLDDAIRLAWLASQIPDGQIKSGQIGADQVLFAMSPDGTQEVLKPLTEKVRQLRDEIFSEVGPTSPIAVNIDLTELVKMEGARVAVLNGSSTSGLAARTTDYLKSLGINVVQTDNANEYTPYTMLRFYFGKPYTIKYLVELLKVSPFRINHTFDPAAQADIVLVLGDDWAASNSMP